MEEQKADLVRFALYPENQHMEVYLVGVSLELVQLVVVNLDGVYWDWVCLVVVAEFVKLDQV